ncbi:MAG: hypothetical protein ABI591_17080 [Kofleriaceae bacterium]
MRWLPLVAVLAGSACGGSSHDAITKRPNTELIVGSFERHPPDGTTIARFQGDGTITVAHDQASLDRKNLAVGQYKLDGDQLTLTYTEGEMCKPGEIGTYKVVLSKIGMRFAKISDSCATRAKIDGQTWFRVQ